METRNEKQVVEIVKEEGKLLDIILSNQNEMKSDISEIKNKMSKIDLIEHQLGEGKETFKKLDEKIDTVSAYCTQEGCRNPHLVTVFDHLKRHIGDIDSFLEKTTKTIEGEKIIDVLEDMSKEYIKKKKFQEEIKNDNIKRFTSFGLKILGIAGVIGIIIVLILLFGNLMETLTNVVDTLEQLKQVTP